jgi:hypothetical protein
MEKIINRVIATTACLIAVAIVPISASALSKGSCTMNWEIKTEAEAVIHGNNVGTAGSRTFYYNCCLTKTSTDNQNYWISVSENYTPACSDNVNLTTSSNCNNDTPVLTRPRTYSPTNMASMIDNPTATTSTLTCNPGTDSTPGNSIKSKD